MTIGPTTRPLVVIGVIAALLAAAFVALAAPQIASAHPLGNFTVNRYSRIEVYSDKLRVNYVLDMAEIPTFQDATDVDTNGDGTVSDAEAQAYAASKAAEIETNLGLQLNGESQTLHLTDSHVSFPAGQGGL
jgi:nickel/cobalt transporter (NicO) family protein